MMSGWVRITVRDLETGEEDAVEVRDDYVLVAVGDCHLAHTQVSANGTHVLTVKNSRGEKRGVAGEPVPTDWYEHTCRGVTGNDGGEPSIKERTTSQNVTPEAGS